MGRVGEVVALGALGLGALGLGCSPHPDEGTVVEAAPGISGVPGGDEGVTAKQVSPISGGTLAISEAGMAVAADPDRDRVFLVDLATREVTPIATAARAEPGRVVIDSSDRAHVALRRTGEVLSIDLSRREVLATRAVCPAPRGLAYDDKLDALQVACDTGELVTLPASGGASTRSLFLGRDLRDVVVEGDTIRVSKFRSAEVLTLDAEGAVVNTARPATSSSIGLGTVGGFEASVAWRMVGAGNGRVVVAHQRANPGQISIGPGGYYTTVAPCATGIVHGTVSMLSNPSASDSEAMPQANPAFSHMVGPSDVAVSPDGKEIAVVSSGNSWSTNEPLRVGLIVMPLSELSGFDPCDQPGEPLAEGEPTSVAYTAQGQVVVQSRQPATIEVVGGPVISLSKESRADTGTAMFHMNSGFGIACASCHPEGREDGRVWNFVGIGPRRTQAVAGGLMATAPFHWSGDVADLPHLVHDVFVSRMGGPRPNRPQVEHFSDYLDRIPAPVKPSLDAAAVARGAAIFHRSDAECGTCHQGELLTNNNSYDVGTGGLFQVPSLVGLDARAPFMHDGCASTLADRFEPCGGSAHGQTAQLGAAEKSDLIQYLRSL